MGGGFRSRPFDGHRQCGWHRDPPLGRTNDDSVTGYQILRRRPREGEKTLLVHVNDTGSTATEYTDNDVTPDMGHAYRVKAINAEGLSRRSNFVNATPRFAGQEQVAGALPTVFVIRGCGAV